MESLTCPDPETLAAFVDGRLSAAERETVLVHLDSCRACREIVAEAAAVLDDLDAQDGATETTGSVRGWPGKWWMYGALPLAASLLLVAVFWRNPGLPTWQPLSSSDLVDDMAGNGGLAAVSAEELVFSPWRGRGECNASRSQAVFRMGADLVALRAAIVAGEPSSAAEPLKSLNIDLDCADFQEFFSEDLEAIRDALKAPDDRAGQLAALEAFENVLTETGNYIRPRERFDLGRWAQAGRLAATAGHGEFFDRKAVQRVAREALEVAGGEGSGLELSPEERRALESLDAQLARRGEPQDFAALRGQFETLLQLGGGG